MLCGWYFERLFLIFLKNGKEKLEKSNKNQKMYHNCDNLVITPKEILLL